MISKIISLIIRLLLFIFQCVFGIIVSFFPDIELTALGTGITGFFNLLGNAVNMTYFLIGPGMYLVLDIIIAIWATKHLVMPVVILLRKVTLKN